MIKDLKGLENRNNLRYLASIVSIYALTILVMSPDIVTKLLSETGYVILKSSMEMDAEEMKKSLYYERDILVIFKLKM